MGKDDEAAGGADEGRCGSIRATDRPTTISACSSAGAAISPAPSGSTSRRIASIRSARPRSRAWGPSRSAEAAPTRRWLGTAGRSSFRPSDARPSLSALGRARPSWTGPTKRSPELQATLRPRPAIRGGVRRPRRAPRDGAATSPAAERQFIEALRIDPARPSTLFNLGGVAMGRGRFDEAAAWYRKALAVKPDFPDARRNLARRRRIYGTGDPGHAATVPRPGSPNPRCNAT